VTQHPQPPLRATARGVDRGCNHERRPISYFLIFITNCLLGSKLPAQTTQRCNARPHCPHMPRHRSKQRHDYPTNAPTPADPPTSNNKLPLRASTCRAEARSNDEGRAGHQDSPRTSTHHHCCEQLLAGWMGGANRQGHQGTRHRANNGYDDMDTKGMDGDTRGRDTGPTTGTTTWTRRE
jgi:hypothetical protein